MRTFEAHITGNSSYCQLPLIWHQLWAVQKDTI